MACDICGKTASGTALEEILPQYQTRTVKQICPDCLRVANKALAQMRDVANVLTKNLFKRYLDMARAKAQGLEPESIAGKPMHPEHDDSPDSNCNCPSCR